MTITTMRILIPDKIHYDRSTAAGDGVTVDFALSNKPIVPGSQKVYVAGVLKATPGDYTIDTDLGLVTFLVAPVLAAEVIVTYLYMIFSDADLTAMLVAEGNDDKLGTALALETIASDTAMVLKVIKLLDLTTDGAKTSDALLARAKLLRAQAAAAAVTGAIDWAEMVLDDFSYREFLEKEALRDA